MRIRFDNILLSVLWLLAVTLGTCFWFNTVFGFDIFSGAHWEYISSLQAAQTPIKPGFYVSMAIAIFITILGLYMILAPRRRRIRLPIIKTTRSQNRTQSTQSAATQQNVTPNNDASTLDILPAEMQPAKFQTTPPQQQTSAPSVALRPPRLNIPRPNTLSSRDTTPQRTNPASTHGAPAAQKQQDWPELREIFTSAGYTVKPTPRIGGIQTALVAIGTNEAMWLGCVGVKTTDVRDTVNKFEQIFADTLDETSITINGFAIAAPDADTSEFQDILMFRTPGELREFIQQNPNPPLPADDDGMFDAFSEYIDAVLAHIGKL